MMETIIQWDKDLFHFINHNFANETLDAVMCFVSQRWSWLALYTIVVGVIIYVFRKKSWIILLSVGILVATTDLISYRVFKKQVERYRPCRKEAMLEFEVRQLPCATCSEYGFVSSHAANSFAIAVFVGLLFYKKSKWWIAGGLLWAFVISISRVYLGVHYPLDVLGGAILGTSLAFLFYKIIRLKIE